MIQFEDKCASYVSFVSPDSLMRPAINIETNEDARNFEDFVNAFKSSLGNYDN